MRLCDGQIKDSFDWTTGMASVAIYLHDNFVAFAEIISLAIT